MSFPNANVHRRSRRKLGRGQYPGIPAVGVVVSSTGTTNATLTFARPVQINGNVNLAVATRTLVSQTVVSPLVVTQEWSGNVTGLAYVLTANSPAVSTPTGGGNSGAIGTFP